MISWNELTDELDRLHSPWWKSCASRRTYICVLVKGTKNDPSQDSNFIQSTLMVMHHTISTQPRLSGLLPEQHKLLLRLQCGGVRGQHVRLVRCQVRVGRLDGRSVGGCACCWSGGHELTWQASSHAGATPAQAGVQRVTKETSLAPSHDVARREAEQGPAIQCTSWRHPLHAQ